MSLPDSNRKTTEERLACLERLLKLHRERPRSGTIPSPLREIGEDAARKGGLLAAPLVVMMDLTSHCNQDCVFCYRSGPATLMRDGKGKHLSLENLERICGQLARMGVPSVALSGGEPTGHPQFLDAVALVKRHDLALTLITNGTRLRESQVRKLKGLLEPVRDVVELSLDAATPEVFRKIARADLFPSLLSTLEAFKRHRIPFLTMTLILRDNQDQIDRILDLAAAHGARECAVEFPFPKRGIPAEAYAPMDDVLDLHERLLRRGNSNPPVILNFLHLSMNIPGGLEALLSAVTGGARPLLACHGGEASCAIDIDGNVHLCQFIIDRGTCRVGNVFETPLPDLWRRLQETKRSVRDTVPGGCGCPAFALEAAAAPAPARKGVRA